MNALLTIEWSKWLRVPESLSLNMKLNHLIAVLIPLAVLGAGATSAATAEDGVAVAIVYDTSGSMKDAAKVFMPTLTGHREKISGRGKPMFLQNAWVWLCVLKMIAAKGNDQKPFSRNSQVTS